MLAWEFERDGEVVKVDTAGPLIVRAGAATDLAVDAAVAETGIIHLFEDWLQPNLERGALEFVLEPWWQRFSGPFLYYPGRPYLTTPLRAEATPSRVFEDGRARVNGRRPGGSGKRYAKRRLLWSGQAIGLLIDIATCEELMSRVLLIAGLR